MDPGPGVITVAHSYLADLATNSEKADLLLEYLYSSAESDGGEVERTEYVKDQNNEVIEVLVKFSDVQCSEKVCARQHYLTDIFTDESCPDSLLVVKPYNTSGEFDKLNSDRVSLLSTQSDYADSTETGDDSRAPSIAGDDMKDVSILITEFPDDVEIAELVLHFQETCQACVKASHYDDEKKYFVLEFSQSDAERILENPRQLLDDDDSSTTITIEQLSNTIKDVLVIGEKPMTKRMFKKAFKDFGEVENSEIFTPDKLQFIVTFSSAEAAEALATEQVVAITPQHKVQVQLYVRDSPDKTSCSDKKDSRVETSCSVVASPPASLTLSRTSPQSSLTPEHQNKLKQTRQPSPNQDSVTAVSSPFFPKFGSTPSASFNTSISHPSTSNATHIEVDLLPDYEVMDMYQLLCIHFQDIFGEDRQLTTFNQSYDVTKNVFRLDFDPKEIATLMSNKQILVEDDDDSTLTLTMATTGKTVALKVVKNPGTFGLSRTSLIKCFGLDSPFSSQLTIHGPYKNRANITLDTCSVAARVVQIGEHTLDNKIVLEASFSIEELPPSVSRMDSSSSEITDSVLLVSSTAPKTILQKLVTTKTKGVLMDQVAEGEYLVEYTSSKAARDIADQKVIKYLNSKMNVSLYRPDVKMEESLRVDEEASDESDEEELTGEHIFDPKEKPTHVVIKIKVKDTPQDTYTKFIPYFKKLLGHRGQTTFAQSHDAVEEVFRFDFSHPDITKLMAAEHELKSHGEKTKFSITPGVTGKTVSISRVDSGKLSKRVVNETFGKLSSYKSDVTISSIGRSEAILEFNSYSVAARFASRGRHELIGGVQVKVSFVEESDDESSSDDNSYKG
ncbi:uncharacterized protein [Watersipora subatra]|uniref:uncharacterized protein n=1 Tax=Watersipora subatra TaxID=2589382 RepID=UPI00355BEF63